MYLECNKIDEMEMVHIYKHSEKAIRKQFMYSGFLIFPCILSKSLFFSSIIVIVAILFIRDAIKMKKTEIKLDDEGISLYVKDELRKKIIWKDMVYVVVKSKKWLVLGDDNTKITLTDSIEDLRTLAVDVINYNRKNKKLFVDPSVREIFGINIELKNHDGGNIVQE